MSRGRRSAPLPSGWDKTRRRILRRDGRRCYLCGGTAAHVDHIVPACDGGTDDAANLAAICEECHGKKTAREANAAKPKRARPKDVHPGLLSGR